MVMGWRNAFTKIDDKVSFKKIKEFVDHHNNWTHHFTEEEVKKMWDDDEIPGEDLEFKVIYNKKTKEYWGYLGSYGGMSFSFDWKERYFPDLIIYDSTDFPHYNDDKNHWSEWPIYTTDEYRKLLKKEKKKECKKEKEKEKS
tara:strand:+ start:1498 stop:1923 length:426 start_codon:yes stop_codon:yes gene_type:complete